ncbi:MAG: glycosyltransferase [Polaribacter sp.]
MKINILHISTATTFRGGEQQVCCLIKVLQKENVSQTLICPLKAPISERINKDFCKVINTVKPSSISFSLMRKIKETCKNKKISIIHAHDSKAHTAAVLSVFKNKLDVKVIVTRRVLFPVLGYFSKLKYKTNIVAKVICISKAVQLEMQKLVKIKKISVITDGIDIEKFQKIKGKNFSFFNNSTIKVAYIAALTHEKDHVTFLKTVQLILKKQKGITFYLVGEGKLKNDIKGLIKKMNLQENVVLTGFIKDIPELIPQLDYLLFTSKCEGLGTTILDFYLAKKPVITTNCGGNNEIALHKKTAMVSKVGDYKDLAKNFIKLSNDSELRKKIVFNAYHLVYEDFSIIKLGKNTLNEYKNVLNL